MLLKVFTIYDSKAEAYLQPFFLKNKGEAIRALTDIVAKPDHNFCKYPEDFTLFELGVFDDSTSRFELYDTPHSVCVLIELKRSVTPSA
ncbi:MAG: DNA binding protein [Microviridae sp. ctjWc39]|nr:MAG: DNA binding protein [Microviridae sp. ctjWc39]QGH72365.1 MAG: DNA binding protein [Microviridae sp. ctGWf34]